MDSLFDRPDCRYLLPNGECDFDYIPCNELNQNMCDIHNSLDIANKIFKKEEKI